MMICYQQRTWKKYKIADNNKNIKNNKLSIKPPDFRNPHILLSNTKKDIPFLVKESNNKCEVKPIKKAIAINTSNIP